jgi:hypothetical protein
MDGGLREANGRTHPPSKTAGGLAEPLNIGLRRWWDPNQEEPDEGHAKTSTKVLEGG